MSRMLSAVPIAALALLAGFAGRSSAQYVVYPTRPAVTYYYTPAPAPVVYVAPRVTYYAPAAPVYVAPGTTVTTYRPYAVLPRRRVTVRTYYSAPPAVYGPVYYR